MKIDFTAKKTETEWSEFLANFVIDLSRAAFTIVGWCMMIAALIYLNDKWSYKFLEFVELTLRILLLLSIQSFFLNKFEIVVFSDASIAKSRRRLWAHVLVNSAVAAGLWYGLMVFTTDLADTVAAMQMAEKR